MNYYLFAMLTIPFLLYWLFKFKRPLEMLVILAAVSMGVAIYLQNFSEWAFWQDGWMLLVKLNLVAYYGYFNLLAFSLVGAAIGIFLIGFKYENRQLYTLFAIAIIAILIGVVLDGLAEGLHGLGVGKMCAINRQPYHTLVLILLSKIDHGLIFIEMI